MSDLYEYKIISPGIQKFTMPAGFNANVEVHAWGAAGGGGYTSYGGGGGYATSFITINEGDVVEFGVGDGGGASAGGSSTVGGVGGNQDVIRTPTISRTLTATSVRLPTDIANGYFTRTAAAQGSPSAGVREYYVRLDGVTVWDSASPPPSEYRPGTYRGSIYYIPGVGGQDFLNTFDLIADVRGSSTIISVASEFAGGSAANGQDPDYDRDMGPGGGGGAASYVKVNGVTVLVAAGGGGGGGPPEEFGRGYDGIAATNSLTAGLRSTSTRGANSSGGATTGGGGGGGYYGGAAGTSRGDDQAPGGGGYGGQNYGLVTLAGSGVTPGGTAVTYYPGTGIGYGGRWTKGGHGFMVLVLRRSFTASVKDSGAWKKITRASVKVGGVWKNITNVWTKVDGAWKEITTAGAIPVGNSRYYDQAGTYNLTLPTTSSKVVLDVLGTSVIGNYLALPSGSSAGVYHRNYVRNVTPGETLTITVGTTGNTTVTGSFGTLSSSGINDTGGNIVSHRTWSSILNTYGIWRLGLNTTDEWNWRIYFPTSGSYTILSSIDNSGAVYIDGSLVVSVPGFSNNYSATVSVTAGIHMVKMVATDVGVIAGAGLVIYNSSSQEIFSSRSVPSSAGLVNISF